MSIEIRKYILTSTLLFFCLIFLAQTKESPAIVKNGLRYNLTEDGRNYFQVTFLNQSWLRFNENNPGSTLMGKSTANTFDIGLRRTRIQLFGQISDRTFLYFQFGQNNFNNVYSSYPTTSGGAQIFNNRKVAAFFHDALCEFNVIKGKNGNTLKIGSGLTIMNGLSRFSQPSISTIATLDVPVFLQYSVDQIDEFDRRLAVYARGQISKLDYRFYLSNPFPISSNGNAPPALDSNSNFVNYVGLPESTNPGLSHQYGGYLSWSFFDLESHTTPYMTGTYLGSKKIFNIAVGGVYQKNATWHVNKNSASQVVDTVFSDMLHLGIETFLDIPLNKEKKSALNAFAGYYLTNYGPNYLRYNGLMNPCTGFSSSALSTAVQKSSFGNAFPMFGTGSVAYFQVAYLIGKNISEGETKTKDIGQFQPFMSCQLANYEALQHRTSSVVDAGINWLVKGHQSKVSLDFQSRPTFKRMADGEIKNDTRKNCFILQYQVFI